MLGKQLQLQTAQLAEAKQSCSTKEGVQQLLEQANNTDIVRIGDLIKALLPLDGIDKHCMFRVSMLHD